MPLTSEQLKDLPADKPIVVVAEGQLHTLESVYISDEMKCVVLAAKETAKANKRFSIEDQKFLIRAVSVGIPVEMIAQFLSCEPKKIKSKMKEQGIAYL